ncbi:MAG: glucose-1-phosphate adenylyltransferase subunit GlgD [Muribaculaceae bacterium]|nr:glucose-1-phosphate adenylyltransferase subunit GlgD [Roseburia sp.]MCM1430516.1 glucose-1-phosphate adenylyltransferase subunit GlgD [Muribaculaceae bacterium]MCM1493189.1 glucose-1-phosphate adenylyltransferase subunit GlgD [Muribaculaceae bacterium]
MVNSKAEALGIIFPNSYDSLVPDLVSERLMASIPFAGRYRMCDFLLSSMVHSGIDNISVIVRKNYHSLLDHLGSGREWDLTRKKGGLNIVPPFAQRQVKVYAGRIEALESIKGFLKKQTEKYVIMSDANIAVNFDFRDLLDAHIKSGADVTMVYRKQEIPEALIRQSTDTIDLYYSLGLNGDRVSKIYINPSEDGEMNFSLNIYVIERELLIRLIDEAYVHGLTYFVRDLLEPQVEQLDIRGYCYEGYVAHIHDMKSYFEENMRLLDEENLDALFSGNQIYTKIRDDNPTRYINGSVAKNVMLADGCVVEGTVENSILFRGVKIGKGAVVKNCVLMQDTVVEEGANVDYVITDKNVTISKGKSLTGNDSFQVYVSKGQIV